MKSTLLTREARLYLGDLARGRSENKDHTKSRKMSANWDDTVLDYVGLLGEEAAAQVYGGKVDATFGPGDGGIDMMTSLGRLAVKTNHRKGGYLLVERLSDLANVDHVVLATLRCDPPRCSCMEDYVMPVDGLVDVIGHIPVADFLTKHRKSNWGLGWRMWMRGEELEAA